MGFGGFGLRLIEWCTVWEFGGLGVAPRDSAVQRFSSLTACKRYRPDKVCEDLWFGARSINNLRVFKP